MNIDSDAVWQLIQRDDGLNFRDSVAGVIDCCASSHPSERWRAVYDFSWDDTVAELKDGFVANLPALRGHGVNGIYLGITTLQLTNGDFSFGFEIGGARNYDPDDADYNWIFDLVWRGAPFLSRSCHEVYAYAQGEQGLGNDLEWPLGLAIAVFGFRAVISEIERDHPFDTPVGVVAGFHDGDMLRLRGFHEKPR